MQVVRKLTRKRIASAAIVHDTENNGERHMMDVYCKFLGAGSQLGKEMLANRRPLMYKPFANITIKL